MLVLARGGAALLRSEHACVAFGFRCGSVRFRKMHNNSGSARCDRADGCCVVPVEGSTRFTGRNTQLHVVGGTARVCADTYGTR